MRTQIYCDASPGSLLSAVQNSHLFPDCKHFVDMPIKHDAATVLQAWAELVAQTGGTIDRPILMSFVEQHFDEPGCELEDHLPDDFNTEQTFDYITDPHYKDFARNLHLKWPTLCRRIKNNVLERPENYSLLALPNPFVVPGGRFRELYYWDSFWSIKGLISSQMFGTVRGMILNMAHLVEQYGFIPNGNRIYYLNRSQPPLLTWCVEAYYAATQDLEFVAQMLPILEKEMEFFKKEKLINQAGWKSALFQFRVSNATGPRPESYREDMEAAEHFNDVIMKQRLWGDIAAAAESGRDFSCRWFDNTGAEYLNKMSSIRTASIIPVELNSIICSNLRIFADFYTLLGQHDKAAISKVQYELMREAIHQVFWNEEQGCWFDFDLSKNAQIEVFHDTNFFPLFSKCFHDSLQGERIVEYLTKNGILNFNGIPTSLVTSGQQWDFPSGWAPMNWMVIIGLKAIGQVELAKQLASKWVAKNFLIFLHAGTMFEKYDVSTECFKSRGGGGEYELQEGFGWTNGVILDLLKEFSTELVFDTQSQTNSKCECCRPQPIIETQMTVTDSTVNNLSLPVDACIVDASALAEQQNAISVAAALAAELANNTPGAAISADGPALIRV